MFAVRKVITIWQDTSNGDLPQDSLRLTKGLNSGNPYNLSSHIFHIYLRGSLFSLTSLISLILPRFASTNHSIGSLLKWEIFDKEKHYHLA